MKVGINRKQLGVTLVIIGLMTLLFSAEAVFKRKLNQVALLDSDMKTMKVMNIRDGEIAYKLPESWDLEEKSFPSEAIINYNEYRSRDKIISGFMSVEKSSETIEKAIERHKVVVEESYTLKNYTSSKIVLSSGEAYRVSYEYTPEKSGQYIAHEYYLDKGEYLVKFTFYVVKDRYKDTMVIAFNTIVESLALNF